MSTKAALMGKGILMADLILTRDELESGQLVLPFPEMIAVTDWGDFGLRISPGRAADPKVKAFADWALEAAAPDLAYCRERLAKVPVQR
jgi:LysR family glycine cleavage system transcriptional activator